MQFRQRDVLLIGQSLILRISDITVRAAKDSYVLSALQVSGSMRLQRAKTKRDQFANVMIVENKLKRQRKN